MINIEVFPANSGDSIILDINDKLLLIDCGFSDTYSNYLKPCLLQHAKQEKILNRLIITHIDNDHIIGAINFLEENGQSSQANIIPIEQIWHNSYKHIQTSEVSPYEISDESKKILQSIKTDSSISNISNQNVSCRQGSSLGSLILEGKYNWNGDFAGNAITADFEKEIDLGSEIKLLLLSPYSDDLILLEKKWRRELYKLGFRETLSNDQLFDDAFEFLLRKEKCRPRDCARNISSGKCNVEDLLTVLFEEDTSSSNRSSLSFVISYRNKKLLFLGDSCPSIVEKSLINHYGKQALPIMFDFIKIAHHGSKKNSSPNLMTLIDSSKYCISTNGGSHQLPDPETIALIISRQNNFKRNLFLNYRTVTSRFFDKNQIKQKFNYEIHYPKNNETLVIQV